MDKQLTPTVFAKKIGPRLLRTSHRKDSFLRFGFVKYNKHSFLHMPKPSSIKLSILVDEFNLCIDHLSQLVKVFGDFCDCGVFLCRMDIEFDVDSYDKIPFFIYTLTTMNDYVLHVPCLTEEATLLIAFMLRGKGITICSDIELTNFLKDTQVRLYNLPHSW